MNRYLAPLILLAVACHTHIPSQTPHTTAVADPRFEAAITQGREVLVRRASRAPGMTVAIAVDGTIVWAEGVGWEDIKAKRSMTAETPLRIYSVAKPMTAALSVRLAEAGRIDLAQPVDLAPSSGRITMLQLLSHMSGIRDYRRFEWMRLAGNHCETPASALAAFASDPLEARPGEKWQYSTFNYVLASAVLERAGGSPFHQLLRKEVLDPAGMRATTPDTPAGTFYEAARFGRVRSAPAVDNSCKFGAGGLRSTAPDLVRFGTALLEGRIVSSAGLARLFTPMNRERDYALGFGITRDEQLGPIAAHSGSAVGGTAYLLLAPEKRIVVAIIANMETERFRDEARAIARAFIR